MKTNLIAGALIACATAATVQAQDFSDISVGVGVTSFGANLEAAYRIDPQYGVRGALMGGISADFDETDDEGVTASGDFDLGGAAVLVDYYPNGGAWRLSGGLFFSNTELTATGEVDLEGGGTENVTLNAEFANQISPMVTTGYEYAFGQGWSFNSEIGLVFTGGIDLEVTASDPSAQQDIDDDQDVQDAISDAGDIFAYPYISLGVSYRY